MHQAVDVGATLTAQPAWASHVPALHRLLSPRKQAAMTVPRLLGLAAIAAVFYVLGTRHDKHRLERMRIRAQQAWHDPKLKKAGGKLLKLSKKNAKTIDKGVHHKGA